MAGLREVDRVFSTYRPTRSSPGSGAARSAWPTARPRWPRCWGSATGAEASPAARSGSAAPAPTGGTSLDPSGVVKGWAVERAAARAARAARTPTSASRPAGTWSAAPPTPTRPPWRIGIEDPHDPRRLVAVVPVRTARSRPPAPPTAARTSSTPAPGAARGRRLGHGRRRRPDLGRHRRHRGVRPGRGRRRAGCAPGPAARGLVVWADGSTTLVELVTREPPRVRRYVDGVLAEQLDRDDLEGPLVGGREHHGRRAPASNACSQRAATTHHRSPGCRPGNRHSGRGVARSLPTDFWWARNSGSSPRTPRAARRPRARRRSSRRGRSRSSDRCRRARARRPARCARSWDEPGSVAGRRGPTDPVAFLPWPHVVDRVDDFQQRHPVVGFPLAVAYKFFDDQGNYLAAIITYYAFIAIFPLLLIASSVLGLVLQRQPRAAPGGAHLGAPPVPDRRHPARRPGGPAGQRVGRRDRDAGRAVRRAGSRPGRPERRQRHLGGAAQQPAQPDRQPAAQRSWRWSWRG